MDKIAIITDSVSCLPQKLIEHEKIQLIPAGNVLFEGKIYHDLIDLTHQQVYHFLETTPQDFFTGPTTPNQFLELFKKLSKKTEHIIYISLSSKLSTLNNVAHVAMDIARKEMPDLHIHIIDSATATAAEGFVALAAARAVIAGKDFHQVIEIAESVKQKVDLFYVLDTIRYVYRTGRVPKSISDFGSMLNVKPIVTIRNGSAQVKGLVRNMKHGEESLLRFAREKINGSGVHIAVLHAGVPEEAEELKRQISKEFKCNELWVSEFSPLMIYATGRGVLGIAFYTANIPVQQKG
jgi:DegV family protein with EDD domain